MDKLDFGYYNMDCMAGMKLFPDKYFDVAIVDPPYGINAPNMAMGTNKSRTKNGYPSESTASRLKRSGQVKEWDSKPPTEEYFKELFRVSKNQIIWGGNYFNLPPTKCFVVWDKVQPWDAFSQAEIAWTSYNLPAKLFRYSNTGGRKCLCGITRTGISGSGTWPAACDLPYQSGGKASEQFYRRRAGMEYR